MFFLKKGKKNIADSTENGRMVKICSQKCIDKTYREGELAKGEAVCLDRCSAKFFEAHQKISDQLQNEMQARGGAGGGFGMGA